MSHPWLSREEQYLRTLFQTSAELSRDYSQLYEAKQRQLHRIKLPSIVLSTVAGTASFGTGTFGASMAPFVSIAVGVTGLFVAILNTLETFFKIGETAAGARVASLALRAQYQRIEVELSLPLEDRRMSGIGFLREEFTYFQSILEKAPHIPSRRSAQDRLKAMSETLTQAEGVDLAVDDLAVRVSPRTLPDSPAAPPLPPSVSLRTKGAS